jgi:hypothetical protein
MSFGPTVNVTLECQVFAFLGDKGASVNCGLFSPGKPQDEWDWLRSFMSTLLELLGDDAKAIERGERVEFPLIQAVHFVLWRF